MPTTGVIAVCLTTLWLLMFPGPIAGVSQPDVTARAAPPVDTLVAWLDRRETEWEAAAWLQQMDHPPVQAILEPYRTRRHPNCTWGGRMKALVKIGDPAVPAIGRRLFDAFRGLDADPYNRSEIFALLDVLGAIGPAATPTLVRAAAEAPFDFLAEDALRNLDPHLGLRSVLGGSSLVLEPEAEARIARAIQGELPRIRLVLEQYVSRPASESSAPHGVAAFYLARLGDPGDRTRGLEVLEGLARAPVPYYRALEWARLLHHLKAPGVASVLRHIGSRVPPGNERAHLAIGHLLFEAGDDGLFEIVSTGLESLDSQIRASAIRAAGDTGNLWFVPFLIARLEDDDTDGRDTLGDMAVRALQRLTLQLLERDVQAWTAWWGKNREAQRAELADAFVTQTATRIRSMPIKTADALFARLLPADTAPLIEGYLRRRDLGDTGRAVSVSDYGGDQPPVMNALRWLAARDERRGRALLSLALRASAPNIRHHAALILADYDRPAASAALARELGHADQWVRRAAADALLIVGDARGIPVVLEQLDPEHRAWRYSTCFALRRFTQIPLPCDESGSRETLAEQARQWRRWWTANPGFVIPRRQADFERRFAHEPVC